MWKSRLKQSCVRVGPQDFGKTYACHGLGFEIPVYDSYPAQKWDEMTRVRINPRLTGYSFVVWHPAILTSQGSCRSRRLDQIWKNQAYKKD